MKKKVLIAFLILGAVAMWVMSFHYLLNDDSGILRNKKEAVHLWYILFFRTHILFGLLAILVGPLQFVRQIRDRYPRFHGIVGYIYATCVLFSGLSGLVIAQFSMGGWTSRIGFTALSVVWLLVTLKSISAIIYLDIMGHKKWSYLGYSLTFAAITQRTLLLVPLLTPVPFMGIYRLSAWLPWLLNLWVAHRLYRYTLLKKKIDHD